VRKSTRAFAPPQLEFRRLNPDDDLACSREICLGMTLEKSYFPLLEFVMYPVLILVLLSHLAIICYSIGKRETVLEVTKHEYRSLAIFIFNVFPPPKKKSENKKCWGSFFVYR